jgi:hypothetical protein
MTQKFLKSAVGLTLFGIVLFSSCEEVELLLPPDNDGEVVKTGTGDSDARGMLYVLNEVATLFVPNDDFQSSELITDDVTEYLANDQFARPLDPANASEFSLDIFPTLKSNDFLTLEPPIGNLQQSTHPGAFGVNIDEEWHVNSNWWVLDPQMEDYGFDPDQVVNVSGRISANTTWTANNKYFLQGQVFVEDGVTLTIEPGTIIFGANEVGINSGVLIFNRGSKVNANGTPDKPIIFTGTSSPGERSRGQWGGVYILGKAPNNKGENVLSEGLQGSEENDGRYGGNIADDNSGSFSFWRVEYAGIAVGPGNELNAITLGSVGSATEGHHIIISGGGDDAIEWFGGSIDMSYLATYNTLDDDMDIDAGFSGNLQYLYLVRNPFSADESGSANFEVSSSKSIGTTPRTVANISNATVVGSLYQVAGTDLFADPKYQGGMFSKDDAGCTIINSIFIGCPIGVQNP